MQRKAHLRRKFTKLGIDGLLITDLNNVRYLSGFTGSSGYIILAKKKSFFISDFRYKEQIKAEIKDYTVVIEHTDRSKEIKDICKKHSIKTLGFEDHNVTYGFYRKLLKGKVKLKPLKGVVESLTKQGDKSHCCRDRQILSSKEKPEDSSNQS